MSDPQDDYARDGIAKARAEIKEKSKDAEIHRLRAALANARKEALEEAALHIETHHTANGHSFAARIRALKEKACVRT